MVHRNARQRRRLLEQLKGRQEKKIEVEDLKLDRYKQAKVQLLNELNRSDMS